MKKIERGKKLAFIMSMHLIVVWTLSVWSYTGTGTGQAVRNFFKFASGTVPAPTEYNYVAIIVAPLLFVGGTVGVRKLLDWIFAQEYSEQLN